MKTAEPIGRPDAMPSVTTTTEAPRLLITGAGGPAGLSLARQLIERGFAVVGVDMKPLEIPGVTTVVVPPASAPGMIGVLRRLVAEHSIDVVIPTVSEELPSVAAAADGLGAQVVIGDPGAVLVAHDKLTTSYRLAARGISVPDFALPSDVAGVAGAAATLGSPFIAKPRVSRGGRGVVVVRSEADLPWADTDDSTILQAFAPGEEYAPVVHRDATGAQPPLVVVLEKTGLAGGEVGNATGVRRVDEPEVAALALAAAEALDLTGPVDMDIRRLADGTPVVLEINARFGANSAAAPALLTSVLASLGAPERLAVSPDAP